MGSLALAGLAAACSPFAGLETLAILGLFGLGESLVARRAGILLPGVAAIASLFFAYYLGYLGSFAEHRVIARQMALPWRYGWPTPVLAYGPVFARRRPGGSAPSTEPPPCSATRATGS